MASVPCIDGQIGDLIEFWFWFQVVNGTPCLAMSCLYKSNVNVDTCGHIVLILLKAFLDFKTQNDWCTKCLTRWWDTETPEVTSRPPMMAVWISALCLLGSGPLVPTGAKPATSKQYQTLLRTITCLSDLKHAPIGHQTSKSRIWQMNRTDTAAVTHQDKWDHITSRWLSILKVLFSGLLLKLVKWKQALKHVRTPRNIQNIQWISGLDDINDSKGRFHRRCHIKYWKIPGKIHI